VDGEVEDEDDRMSCHVEQETGVQEICHDRRSLELLASCSQWLVVVVLVTSDSDVAVHVVQKMEEERADYEVAAGIGKVNNFGTVERR
jgi:hypothetical protein